MPARAMPTTTIRCGPGQLDEHAEVERAEALPGDLEPGQPQRRADHGGAGAAAGSPRARRGRGARRAPTSSGNSASPALPSRSLAESAGWSMRRLIPITPPTREIWKPKPSWMPGVNPAAKTARNDGVVADAAQARQRGDLDDAEVQGERAVDAVGEDRRARRRRGPGRRRGGPPTASGGSGPMTIGGAPGARVGEDQRRRVDVDAERADGRVEPDATRVAPPRRRWQCRHAADGDAGEEVAGQQVVDRRRGVVPAPDRRVDGAAAGQLRVQRVGGGGELGEPGVARAAEGGDDDVGVAANRPSHRRIDPSPSATCPGAPV